MQIYLGSDEAVAQCGLVHKIQLSNNKQSPLVYLVHGRAGNVDVMWTFRRIIPETSNIIAVQAPLADPIGGFSWWLADDAQWKDTADQSLTQLTRFMEQAELLYALNPSRRIALGFSQGGAMLSMLLQSGHPRLSAMGLLASFVIDTEQSSEHKAPVFIAHGVQDETVSISRAREGATVLQAKGFPVTMVEDQVSHKVGSAGMRELKQWLLQQTQHVPPLDAVR